MAERLTVARPYARAAFEHARQAGELERWSEMLGLIQRVVTDPAFAPFVGNPLVPAESMAGVITDVAGELLDEAGYNFVRILAENRRLGLMPEVSSIFTQYRNRAEGVVDVDLLSAVELDEAQRARFAESLGKRFDKEVRLACEVDESLLGGAVIRAGDTVIDGSVRAQLAALASSLTR